MSPGNALRRRTLLKGVGSVAAVGILAGCPEEDPNDDVESDDVQPAEPADEEPAEPADDDDDEELPSDDAPEDDEEAETSDAEDVETYLRQTDNFEEIEDLTGEDEVDVVVGAAGNDGFFAFEPPAVQIDEGTTVVWIWSGRGGNHNVVHDGGEFESELTDEEEFNFQHAFEEAGTYLYTCTPHDGLGMRGAVIVE